MPHYFKALYLLSLVFDYSKGIEYFGGFQGKLWPGEDKLFSPNGQVFLKLWNSGNLVLKDGSDILWSTGTAGINPKNARMQPNGNLAVYDTDQNQVFTSGTNGNPGALLYVQDDGNLVIQDSSGTTIWDINGSLDKEEDSLIIDTLLTGDLDCDSEIKTPNYYLDNEDNYKNCNIESLSESYYIDGFQGNFLPGEVLKSPNRKITLRLEQDGNVALYDDTSASNPIWSSNTAGLSPLALQMQSGANLVLYDRNVIFSTGTDGNPGALLFVEDDGYIVIKDMIDESGTSLSGTPIWDSIESSIFPSASFWEVQYRSIALGAYYTCAI